MQLCGRVRGKRVDICMGVKFLHSDSFKCKNHSRREQSPHGNPAKGITSQNKTRENKNGHPCS